MANQPRFVAEFLSYHPTERSNPSYQRNNPLNVAGQQPQRQEYGTLYGDTRLEGFVNGVQINPEPSQSPIAGLERNRDQVRRAIDDIGNSTPPGFAPMGASQQELGRRPRRRAEGRSFSLGSTRPLGGSRGRFAGEERA